MKKLIIIIIILMILTSLVSAKLSDETLKEVENLRNKNYSIGTSEDTLFYDSTIEWTRDFLSIWVEDGKLFVETQDGKYFIEMEEIEKEGEE